MLGEVEEGLVGEDRQLGLDKLTEVRFPNTNLKQIFGKIIT